MGFTLEQLATKTKSTLVGDPTYEINGVETLEEATKKEASFLSNPLYTKQLAITQAGVIFVSPQVKLLPDKNFLINESPSVAFQKVLDLLFPVDPEESGFYKVHPSAVIHEETLIGAYVTIGPNAVIEKGASIGDHTVIGAGVFVGAKTTIGQNCHLYPNVTIRERCIVKDRVIIQSGAVIGSCGFGYATDLAGKHHALRQVGNVVIEEDVEIGANTAIDRGRFKTTLIKRGTKIDNLVQIAHQVEVGEDNLIVSQVGIAGSSKTGKNVILAGQVGVVGHISIADGSILAARAAPIKSIEKKGIYSGIPAAPMREYHEQMVHVRNLKKYVTRLKELESRLNRLEGS